MDAKTGKPRGPKRPAYTLQGAEELIREVNGALGAQCVSADLIAQALGHKRARSGAATPKLGALNHYGLLTREGNRAYRVSDLAMAIIAPRDGEERSLALAKAAAMPTVFGELVEEYAGGAVPPMLPNILRQKYRITGEQADELDITFRETMEFAGLLRGGVLYSQPVVRSAVEAEDDDEGQEEEPGQDARGSSDGPSSDERAPTEYQVVLRGRRVAYLKLPAAVVDEDLERIKAWLDFNKEVLTENEAADVE